ncbi:MAG: hypothetical protein ACRDIB_15910, partial [Ardenticatenaceae bacterium]
LLLLCVWLTPAMAAASPPLPYDATSLPEDEQWLLWRKQLYHPPVLPEKGWIEQASPHFRFHVLPGTAAARDLPSIAREAERSLQRVLGRLDMAYEERLEVYLVERVFWQGGAAYSGGDVLIVYGDRNYTDVPLNTYLDHELTHALAASLVPPEGESNSLLAEGLATWATGGHYGPEPIHAMAAALPRMGRYIPLERLLADFHREQHEIAYIEAASFVGWLIERHGLNTVKAFYGAADSPERFFDATYTELEAAWLQWLEQEQGRDETLQLGTEWWAAQIRLFDTMRAYQSAFDSFARELPSAPREWTEEQRTQYQDNQDEARNIALETQLIAASEALSCTNSPAESHALLDEIEAAIAEEAVVARGQLGHRLEVARQLAVQDDALRASSGIALL